MPLLILFYQVSYLYMNLDIVYSDFIDIFYIYDQYHKYLS